jgi:predicted nucleic acid-binding protein
VLDTSVLIRLERGQQIDFDIWQAHGEAYLSAITVSELLMGVHRADTDARRTRRRAYVEAVLDRFPVLEISTGIARVHAETMATLMAQGHLIGAHDLWIAATALYHGFAILTADDEDFSRVAGLDVLALPAP